MMFLFRKILCFISNVNNVATFLFLKSIFLLTVGFSHGKISWLYIQNKIHVGIKDSLSA